MNRQFFKQFFIALVLFVLGYLTFNGKLFAAEAALGAPSAAYATVS